MMMITQGILATPRNCSAAWRSESTNNSRNLLSIHTIMPWYTGWEVLKETKPTQSPT